MRQGLACWIRFLLLGGEPAPPEAKRADYFLVAELTRRKPLVIIATEVEMKKDRRCFAKGLSGFSARLMKLSEENRLKIICFLKDGERCVCDIVEFLRLPHNLISHHLKILKATGLISCQRKGKFQVYRINRFSFRRFLRQFKSIMGGCK